MENIAVAGDLIITHFLVITAIVHSHIIQDGDAIGTVK